MASTNPSSKRIIFKYDQHGVIVTKKLQSFYDNKELFDTNLIAGDNGVSIQAHRVVLCALSEYFLELFRGDQSALKGNVVELKEIEASTLKPIIDFMYSGSIQLSLEMVGGILRTASFLKIKTLIDACCEFIAKNIDSSNSMSWFRLAYELNLPELKTKALECIYTHFEEISKEEELLMLGENELTDLLFNDNPYGDFEEDVFLAMVAWIKHDKSNREHLAFQLLSMVRFQALTPKFILENRKSICTTIESYELICSWLQWHLAPETLTNDLKSFNFKPRKMTNKLAIAKYSKNEGRIKIETFNPEQNAWSIEIEAEMSTKCYVPTSVVIDGKLITIFSRFWSKQEALKTRDGRSHNECSMKYLDLYTSKWTRSADNDKNLDVVHVLDLKGNLCVIGNIGTSAGYCEIYNFSTRKWENLPTPFDGKMWNYIASYNEMLYFYDHDNDLLHSYNVTSNKWTSAEIESSDLRAILGFIAVKGFLYCIGYKKNIKVLKRFNISNNSWCEMASLPPDYKGHFLCSTYFENKIIFDDDCNIYEYNIKSDTWNASIPLERDTRYTNYNLGYLAFNSK